MNEKLFTTNKLHTNRYEIKGYDALEELALDLRWSWDHSADKIWKRLDPVLWDFTHNPWIILQTVSNEKLENLLTDPQFREVLDKQSKANKLKLKTPLWFQQKYPQSPLTCVAYFSMEFMLSEALPIYSGGLGNVAGDQLKAASDLGVPVVAIGLLYQSGYFRQMIDKDGAQQALYPHNDPGQLPITPIRKENGEWLRIEIPFPGWSLWIRAWQVQVGRVKLLLLDTNDPANFPVHRTIAGELYGGGREMRLKQELLLGLGGIRLLEALDIEPEVFHLNECHSAFVVLDRARKFRKENSCSFEIALEATRAGNLFTTHTAVPAGFDCFSPDLIKQYLTKYAEDRLGISLQDLLALGRLNPEDPREEFNMAYLAIRGSGAVNAVSHLHHQVSQHLFAPLFPRWPEDEVPIDYVTNGVHMPSWDSAPADELWTEYCGKNRWLGTLETLEKDVLRIPDEKIWNMRTEGRNSLIEFTRVRLASQLAMRGVLYEFESAMHLLNEFESAMELFDPNALTLGFARRFATYKRPDLLLHDPERLLKILTNPQCPVQLIIAGKAHPADKAGQAIIQKWIQFIRKPEVRPHVIFLGDYDMYLTERLVEGVDVWLNTPRRPWEACGTSGMKVLVNGGLNLSELDGWWAEAFSPELGWALGEAQEHDASRDAAEANELYDLLEREVIPEFYRRDEKGIPRDWINRIRMSMAKLTPHFSANRNVREYTEKYYLPMAMTSQKRSKEGKEIVDWKHALEKNWSSLSFVSVNVKTTSDAHEFSVEVNLGQLDPGAVAVELYAKGPIQHRMQFISKQDNGAYLYKASVPVDLSAKDYTPRIVPHFSHVAIPLEANQIKWQK
jgi:glycogen phosphorylase